MEIEVQIPHSASVDIRGGGGLHVLAGWEQGFPLPPPRPGLQGDCSGFLPLADGESPDSDTAQWEAGKMLLSFPLFLSRGIIHCSITCCFSVTKL